MLFMNAWSWISVILTILCIVWVFGLLVFVLIKKIIERRKAKKEIDNVRSKEHWRESAYERRTKKGK